MVWDSTRLPPGRIIMSRSLEAGWPFVRPFGWTMWVGRLPKFSKQGSAPGR